MAPKTYPPEERFWTKVAKTDGCWNWTASTKLHGYGQFYDGQRVVLAHRWSYEHHTGPIPDGLQIDHLCRNVLCVNPDHLEAVTQWENMRRSDSPTARQLRQTHCKRGHPLSGDNLRVSAQGKRRCLACCRLKDARRRARKGRARALAAASQEAPAALVLPLDTTQAER